jgi:hypothetical protein
MNIIFKDINDKDNDHTVLFSLESNHIPAKGEEISYYSFNEKTSISGTVVHICREYKQDHVDNITDSCVFVYINTMYII